MYSTSRALSVYERLRVCKFQGQIISGFEGVLMFTLTCKACWIVGLRLSLGFEAVLPWNVKLSGS